MEKTVKWFIALTVILAIVGTIFCGQAFNKKDEYRNPDEDSYFSTSVNAYVGGDAYNYIINGTYFTGYAVLGGVCYVCAILLLSSAMIVRAIDEKKFTVVDKSEDEPSEFWNGDV